MDNSKIFHDVYPDLLSRVKPMDLSEKLKILGIQKRGALFIFDFFNHQLVFDGKDFFDTEGADPTPAVKVLICTYILMSPDKELKSDGKLVTFREFPDAGPLFSRFTENTAKIIQTHFSRRREALSYRCLKLGGTIIANQSYDISIRFRALPKIPIILNFNDADELMPASAGFLYHDTAATYLNLQCLSITCTYLTGLLIQDL
jgi:Domain of unknown function (DUF3786)